MTVEEANKPETASEMDGWEWAVVEIFGHRRHAGRTREEEKFGSKMMRVDVPIDGDPKNGWHTFYYGGASIFSFALSDEESVLRINRPYAPAHRITYHVPDVDDASDVNGDEA